MNFVLQFKFPPSPDSNIILNPIVKTHFYSLGKKGIKPSDITTSRHHDLITLLSSVSERDLVLYGGQYTDLIKNKFLFFAHPTNIQCLMR